MTESIEDVTIRVPLVLKDINNNELIKSCYSFTDKEMQVIGNIEKALARYLKYNDKINDLIDILFPAMKDIEDAADKEKEIKKKSLIMLPLLNWDASPQTNYDTNKNVKENRFSRLSRFKKQFIEDLLCRKKEIIGGTEKISDSDKAENNTESPKTKEQIDQNMFYYTAAYTNLMYDMGLNHFEAYKEYAEQLIPFSYRKENKSENDTFLYYVDIPIKDCVSQTAIEMSKPFNFWEKRVLEDRDARIVFIDDSENFQNNIGITGADNNRIVHFDPRKEENGNKILLVDDTQIKNEISEQIRKHKDCVQEQGKEILLIFVVDFIYKRSDGKNLYNTIYGDNIIKMIRQLSENENIPVYIIGYTGGNSPFIVDAGQNSGADIILFKSRGQSATIVPGHNPMGNTGGLFDLIWAIYQTASYFTLFNYIKKYPVEKRVEIILKYFPHFPNLKYFSPFWAEYFNKYLHELYQGTAEEILKPKIK
jgi:hypothetical protein